MTEWLEKPLGDVVTLQRGFDLPKQKREIGLVPVVSSSGISGSHAEARVKGPGVVTGRYGTIGQVFYVEDDFWPLNTTLFVKDFKANDPKFVSYFLRTLDFESFSDKSSVPGINRNHLHAARVRVPELLEQRAIASVLGSLDDKIELNRRMNETLEDMARTLFKSWFVDFDPVRAKMDGREPFGMDDETAALFPDSFEDSVAGEIPKGWGVESIYNVADVIYGAPFSSKLFNEEGNGLPLIRIRDLATHNPKVYTPEEHPKGTKVTAGDIAVGMDGEFRAHIWTGPDAWLNQRVCMFVPKKGVSAYFVKESLRESLAFFERAKTGTTVIHLGKRDIDTFRVIVPDESVMEAFEKLSRPITQQVISNVRESRTLTAIRDALLPKLLSGEVGVGNAERIGEETV